MTYLIAIQGSEESNFVLPLTFISNEEDARNYIKREIDWNKSANYPRIGKYFLLEGPSRLAEAKSFEPDAWDEAFRSSKVLEEGDFFGDLTQQASNICSRNTLIRGY